MMNYLIGMFWVLQLLAPREIVPLMAQEYGVSPRFAACICRHESAFDPLAVGDNGRAVGLWQWHLGSYQHVRKLMGDENSAVDLRADAYTSTETALFAIAHGYESWWTASEHCRKRGE